jgi:putative transposase
MPPDMFDAMRADPDYRRGGIAWDLPRMPNPKIARESSDRAVAHRASDLISVGLTCWSISGPKRTLGKMAPGQATDSWRRVWFNEEQMVKILREADQASVSEVAKKLGVSDVTIYAWRKRIGELESADVKRLRQLEQENAKLKKLVAERDLEIDLMREVAAIWNYRPRFRARHRLHRLQLCVGQSNLLNLNIQKGKWHTPGNA